MENISLWRKATFGEFTKEMCECRKKMHDLMKKELSEEIIEKMRALDKRMDELERREEMYWHQRSMQSWLKDRDKNYKFFHAETMQWRYRNAIKSIKDEAGNLF
ncbi:Kinesin heavy chain [Bienertia sinuspersici]